MRWRTPSRSLFKRMTHLAQWEHTSQDFAWKTRCAMSTAAARLRIRDNQRPRRTRWTASSYESVVVPSLSVRRSIRASCRKWDPSAKVRRAPAGRRRGPTTCVEARAAKSDAVLPVSPVKGGDSDWSARYWEEWLVQGSCLWLRTMRPCLPRTRRLLASWLKLERLELK